MENSTDADVDHSVDQVQTEEDEGSCFLPFTCTYCGYGAVREVNQLQSSIQSVCLNCGEWAVHLADPEELIDAALELADTLSGEVLTEHQAVVYLLREELEFGRQTVAEELDSSPSNVDNLHRRSREKVGEARRITRILADLRSTETEQPTVPIG